ncbi:MAG: hypothetical protein PHC64_05515 [Candidatus Gastranaerophilales bacterium]|nr:hypothetical protein [Candidatus Gastranaerophilales bacterium]
MGLSVSKISVNNFYNRQVSSGVSFGLQKQETYKEKNFSDGGR